MSTDPRARAWIEVDAAALRRNLARIREAAGGSAAMIPMVKADAYGLGVARAVSALEPEDPYAFGVATVDEGLHLRRKGVTRRVLVMSPAPPNSIQDAVEGRLTMSVSDVESLRRVAGEAERLGVRAAFHVEVDTGMGRAGLDWREVDTWSPAIADYASESVGWEGVFTHFHSADVSEAAIDEQWSRFRGVVDSLPLPGGALVHACNSAGALRRPRYAAGGVRPGIFLYGGAAGGGLQRPEPVCTVKARLALVKEVPAGSTVGYGATHRATEHETWATAAIGYGDGLPRALGNRGQALVAGKRVPIIGRISMDLTVVDISHVPGVRTGDVATFIGRDGDQTITLEDVAAHASTINYEILTGLTARLPRIWQE